MEVKRLQKTSGEWLIKACFLIWLTILGTLFFFQIHYFSDVRYLLVHLFFLYSCRFVAYRMIYFHIHGKGIRGKRARTVLPNCLGRFYIYMYIYILKFTLQV
jgi:hypothetical protein